MISLLNDYSGIVAEGLNIAGVEPEVELTEENMASIVAAVISENCTSEEIEAFTENAAEVELALSEGIVQERTIIKFDKKAKLSRAYATALFQVAKEKKDPKFKKLLTVWKLERYLENFLDKKYGNEARRRAKKAVANMGKSKTPIAAKAAQRVAKKVKASINQK